MSNTTCNCDCDTNWIDTAAQIYVYKTLVTDLFELFQSLLKYKYGIYE